MRKGNVKRKTKETDIEVTLNVDGTGNAEVNTGIGFFDHMITAFAVHSNMDLNLKCSGDLNVDCHHTVEDVGIALGKAFAEAMEDKAGISRYGFFMLPMDESQATCSVDIGGRAYLVFDADFSDERIGELDTQMIEEFFRAFVYNSGITLHINLMYGANDHHKCEAIFKTFAHALKAAVKSEGNKILSSKGII